MRAVRPCRLGSPGRRVRVLPGVARGPALAGARCRAAPRRRRQTARPASPRDHPLQRPARPDHPGPGERVREEDGHSRSTCASTTRTCWPTSWSPRGATRRPTCSSPRTRRRCSTSPPSACSSRSTPSTLAQTPSKYNSPNGLWVGISARVSVMIYNTSLLKPSQLPTSAMQLAQPQWKGKIAIAGGETDFQPIVTSVARTYGTAAALRWLEALKANAGEPPVPRQRDDHQRGQPGPGRPRHHQPVLLVPDAGARSAPPNMHSAIAYFAPRDVGYVVDVSGAGILRSSQHEAEAQKFVAFLELGAGPGDHRPQRQLRVPDRVGGHDGTA